MSRAYLTYFCVFAAMVGGLWVILTFGKSLEAPPDLSGEWRVKWDAPPKNALEQGWMKVQQSGRFLTVSFENSMSLSMKLSDVDQAARELRNPVLRMTDGTWTMTLNGNPALGEVQLDLSGPSRHTARAMRLAADGQPIGSSHGH